MHLFHIVCKENKLHFTHVKINKVFILETRLSTKVKMKGTFLELLIYVVQHNGR